MKKTILGISFLLMAAFAGSANAQSVKENCNEAQACVKEQCDKKDCKDKKECKKEDCKKEDCKKSDCKNAECKKDDCKKCECNAKECGVKPCGADKANKAAKLNGACPFEGLNLSADQQAKVKDLDAALIASRKEMREAAKSSETKISRTQARENEITLRTKYLEDLKNILSADQYTTFLQNFYINQLPNAGGMQKMPTRQIKQGVAPAAKIQKKGEAQKERKEKK